jgi:hypothetical protein
MIANPPVGLAYRRQPRPAETSRPARPFDGWQPEPADPTMDAVDRILGRAMVDSAFGRALLANPAAALAAEPMSLALKRLLIGIRAGSLKEFALRALEAQECLQANLAAHEAARDQAPAELSLAGVGTLAGAGA